VKSWDLATGFENVNSGDLSKGMVILHHEAQISVVKLLTKCALLRNYLALVWAAYVSHRNNHSDVFRQFVCT
jgi:hypothetical protein